MLNKLKRFFQPKTSYQDKRDNEANWQLIKDHIKESKNVLDVACDSGFYSLKLAEMGIFVVGFDILTSSLNKARDLAKLRNINNVHFLEIPLTPSNVLKLPKFDTVLCLSVYQHFFRLYGEVKAKEMLINLFRITNKQMFIQMPSKIGKYGDNFSINFNGDKDLTENYIQEIFDGEANSVVSYVGKKKEKPPTENYRYLFLVSRV